MDRCKLAIGRDAVGDRTVWSESPRPRCRLCTSGVLFLAVAVCALVGCRVGPDHEPPAAPLADQWKNPREAGSNNDGNIYGPWWSDVSDPVEGPWWSEFNDPVLDSLIHQAVVANPGLKEACYRVVEVRAFRGVVSGERFPEVFGTGSYAFKKVSGNSTPFSLVSQDAFNFFSTGFDATWELDFWGKYRRMLEAADAEVGVAEDQYGFVLLTLLGDVAATYVELRTFQERIVVANQNVVVQKRTLKLTQARHRAGLTRPLDVAQAKSSLHATQAIIPTLEIGLQQAENRLCILLGEAPSHLRERLGTKQTIPIAPRELALGTPASLLRRRPDVRSAELQVMAESTRIGVAVADLYPQFSLTGTITIDSTDIPLMFSPESVAHKVGPSFRWNILNFGRIRNRIGAQEARYGQAYWRYQTTVLSAAKDVENALTACVQERLRSESLTKAVAAAKESIRLAELYYQKGLANFQSVLDSQRSLLALQDQLTISRANVTLNRIALYKALGGGWETATYMVDTDHELSPPIEPEALPPLPEPPEESKSKLPEKQQKRDKIKLMGWGHRTKRKAPLVELLRVE